MKLAVIIGVAHMSMGVVVKGLNTVYFSNYLSLIFEVFTGLIILLGLFGWMDVLIIAKWNAYINAYAWGPANETYRAYVSSAPSIITVMIDNFLGSGMEDYYYIGDSDNLSQVHISKALVYISLICVPLMLCCKPLILALTMPKHDHAESGAEFDRIEAADNEQNQLVEGKDPEADAAADIKAYEEILNAEGGGDHGSHAIGEIFIHQLIETIEFVLGTVSNTASYLRLWALSLAHSQLADVFLE